MPTVYSSKDNSAIDLSALKGVTVLVTVPAAFSGTCTSVCVPSIIAHCSALREAGADRVMVVSTDPPFAINEWIRAAKWEHTHIDFASDFGAFELRATVGKLSDEKGKEKLPPLLGELIRRSYAVLRDGEVLWRFTEPDTTKYTLKPEDLILEVKKARGR